MSGTRTSWQSVFLSHSWMAARVFLLCIRHKTLLLFKKSVNNLPVKDFLAFSLFFLFYFLLNLFPFCLKLIQWHYHSLRSCIELIEIHFLCIFILSSALFVWLFLLLKWYFGKFFDVIKWPRLMHSWSTQSEVGAHLFFSKSSGAWNYLNELVVNLLTISGASSLMKPFLTCDREHWPLFPVMGWSFKLQGPLKMQVNWIHLNPSKPKYCWSGQQYSSILLRTSLCQIVGC